MKPILAIALLAATMFAGAQDTTSRKCYYTPSWGGGWEIECYSHGMSEKERPGCVGSFRDSAGVSHAISCVDAKLIQEITLQHVKTKGVIDSLEYYRNSHSELTIASIALSFSIAALAICILLKKRR